MRQRQTVTAVRRLLPAALSLALLAPGVALADNAREQALEARIAQLEQQVQALLAAQPQHSAEVQALRQDVAQVKAASPAAVPAGKQPIQLTTITPGAAAGTTFRVGGFIKGDFLSTQTGDGQLADDATGRALYIPGQTPVAGAGGSGDKSDWDTNFHAKFSRLNVGLDWVGDNGDKAGALVELDFFGNALGNQNATNTYGATVRHAYAYWNNWLAGQTWTNFGDATILPETADFIGVTDGAVFVRQAQVRYTQGGFSVALENPETTLINGTSSDRGTLPDLTARYNWKGDWGSFGIGAIVRQLKVDRTVGGLAYDSDAFGGGVTLGGRWAMSPANSLHYQLTAGEGIARYIGLGITGDATLDPARDDLDATGVLAGFVGWRHNINAKTRTNLVYAFSQYDNPAIAGTLATQGVQSIRGNIFYSPVPKVDVGAELMYGVREIEDGRRGDIRRIQFTTKYSF
jgi:hypothetical protein